MTFNQQPLDTPQQPLLTHRSQMSPESRNLGWNATTDREAREGFQNDLKSGAKRDYIFRKVCRCKLRRKTDKIENKKIKICFILNQG